MPRIIDNIETQLDASLLKSLSTAARLDSSVGYFNLRGWDTVADAVDELPESDAPKVRLLIGMADRPDTELREHLRIVRAKPQMDLKEAKRLKDLAVQQLREQLTYGIPSAHHEKTLRQLRRQLSDGSVRVKLYLRHRLHAKLYLCHRKDDDNPRTGYVGSSNLTFSGLIDQGELNVDVLDHDATEKLHEWFEERWNDNFSVDVTEDLIEILDESWASTRRLDPYLVYLKMAYHLSREAREGLLEYGLPESMSRRLLDFQAAAVRVAARILISRGGVLIGDVVGLGKTIVATAIARLLQEDMGLETLIICPKNLVPMWEGYMHEYRVHGQVIPLSMVTRKLDELRRHRLVVIDESHNLRNPKGQRYAAIRDYIERNDSKVILLTATPYNKQYTDVGNQLGLFVDPDMSLGIRPERAVQELGEAEILRRSDGKPQTLKAFAHSDWPEDWRRLMSLFLIRRTRNFIIENYASEDEEGRRYLKFTDGSRFYFPERIAMPLPHALPDDDPARVMVADSTLATVDSLLLPRYSLGSYLKDSVDLLSEEEEIAEDWARAAGNLIGITRTALYKRLSSSGPAFLISLERHLLRNWVFLNALRSGDPLPIGHVDDTIWDDDFDPGRDGLTEDEDLALSKTADEWSATANAAYATLVAKQSKSIRWVRAELFNDDLEEDLEHDIQAIQGLLAKFGAWDQLEDSKLEALVELFEKHESQKVLVFTEYKDTAEYVATALKARGVADVAAVSGSSDDPTMYARRFSPRSNAEIGGLPADKDELEILVSTDVLSEGQNLQDAAIVVNYDLPWAIIKIIQRAGRIDRIGQDKEEVLVYSFLPADDIDGVIDLRRRIRRRLEENAIVFGSDEEFFGDEGERSLIKGLYDGSKLEDIDDDTGEVDWASNAYEIWRRATEDDPELAARVENLPDVVYSTKTAGEGHEGVVVYAQTDLGYDSLAFSNRDGDSNLLSPHEALHLVACEPETPALSRLDEHHELVAQAVTGPLQSPAAHKEGALTGVRKRCWDRLSSYKERYEGTLFDSPALDRALDELYRKPLLETATQSLSKALRERTPEELADLITVLHQEGRLCVEDAELDSDDLRIVCSMGLRVD